MRPLTRGKYSGIYRLSERATYKSGAGQDQMRRPASPGRSGGRHAQDQSVPAGPGRCRARGPAAAGSARAGQFRRDGRGGADRDARGSPLVSTEWLEKNIDSRKLRIVEVSVDPGVYERGHIPGAHTVAWHTDLVETVSRDIAGPEKFAALARRLGIDRDTTVVLYGDNKLVRRLGRLGLRAIRPRRQRQAARWRAQEVGGREAPARHPHAGGRGLTFAVTPASTACAPAFTDVLAVARKEKDEKILDIRSPDEFGQDHRPGRGAGTGGAGRPHPGLGQRALGQGGEPGRHAEIRRGVAQALRRGRDRRVEAGHHLLPHRRAVEPFLVRAEPGAGYPARNYDGSWTEYGNAVGVPVVNLAGTVWGGK